MKTNSHRAARSLVAISFAAALAACAAPPKSQALSEAKAAYDRAAADAELVRSAPLELRKAQQALQQAEAAQRAENDVGEIDHYAYLARQRTETAAQIGKRVQAEQAAAEAAHVRDRILIDARTRDAEASKDQAKAARARSQALEAQLEELQTKQTERGLVLTLGDVLFDTGRATLNPGAARELDRLATFLKENPERTIEIEGHTDAVGSELTNQTLSERRANAVKNALMDRGIPSTRIAARGFGESKPVASNATAAGRQQNRRVEIVISGKS